MDTFDEVIADLIERFEFEVHNGQPDEFLGAVLAAAAYMIQSSDDPDATYEDSLMLFTEFNKIKIEDNNDVH